MENDQSKVAAIQVRQWLPEWNDASFDGPHQRRPKEHFYLFTLSASRLKSLSGIQRREASSGERRFDDLGIQRRHDPDRSTEIREFVRHGFPWSDLGDRQRRSGDFDDLKKPGWLPTAIVVNILGPSDSRSGEEVAEEDLITIADEPGNLASIALPANSEDAGWQPAGLQPIEVIDGQHRLWAFNRGEFEEDFMLPVVAFHELDLSWQAYLFWTVNIKPKRINASLAFDLYPLLRTEDWLERFEGPAIYRETRAQELTELLWAHPDSPWFHRINMLGERGQGGVSQAAFIRSLTNSFIKAWEGPGVRVGGLFGAPVGDDALALPWTRAQQAAFLVHAWQDLEQAIRNSEDEWAVKLRDSDTGPDSELDLDDGTNLADEAFSGRYSLLNADQGVRGYLQVVNDLSFSMADDLGLRLWPNDNKQDTASDLDAVSVAMEALASQPVAEVLRSIADTLSHFDWRTSSHPSLSEGQRTAKGAFRGSGGYRELRRQLLAHLEQEAGQPVKAVASELRDTLNLR